MKQEFSKSRTFNMGWDSLMLWEDICISKIVSSAILITGIIGVDDSIDTEESGFG